MKKLLLSLVVFTMTVSISLAQVVITEIMYRNPTANGGGGGGGANTVDSLEFLEIHNPTTADINLKGFAFKKGIVDTFPDDVLKAGGYYVICINSAAFQAKFGKTPNHQWKSGNLSNTGETVSLFDAAGKSADSVRYSVITPWPIVGQGTSSIVLCDVTADNNVAANWFASTVTSSAVVGNTTIKASPGAADCPVISVTAQSKSYTTYKGIAIQVPLTTLITPTGTTITITKQPVNGTFTPGLGGPGGIGNNYTYTPKAGFCGTDMVEYKASVGSNFDSGILTFNVLCNKPYGKGSIAVVTKDGNADFKPDSLGALVELTGIVHSPNFATVPAIQFCLIDEKSKEDGIFIAKNAIGSGYLFPVVGDKITVRGTIAQVQGITTVNVDTILVATTKGTPFAPTVISAPIDEDTEAMLLKIKNLKLVDPTKWTTTAAGGGGGGLANQFTVDATDGKNTYQIRVDRDIAELFFDAGPGTAKFNITGVGAQFVAGGGGGGGTAGALNTGYVIMPRSKADLELVTATNDAVLGEKINIFPNPFSNEIKINLTENVDQMIVTNVNGQIVFSTRNPSTNATINTENWTSGVYFLSIQKENKQFTTKIVK